jgi:TetR/AcrR family transcriptional repressor of nem operon
MAGRKKIFDEEEVLLKAIECFWKNGYDGANARNLSKEMGVNIGSIYHSFSSKKGLFISALQYYSKMMDKVAGDFIYSHDNIKEGIKNLFLKIAESTDKAEDAKGCFLGNTIAAMSTKDDTFQAMVAEILRRRELLMVRTIKEAQSKNQIASEKDPILLANYLTNLWHGLNISRRFYPDKEEFKKMILFSLNVLD